MHKVPLEMQRIKIDVLGTSNTRWSVFVSLPTNNDIMYFSVISFTPNQIGFYYCNYRQKPVKLKFLLIYVPTSDKLEDLYLFIPAKTIKIVNPVKFPLI